MPTNYANDILGTMSKGMRLAWCTMRPPPPPPHVSKRSAVSESKMPTDLIRTLNDIFISAKTIEIS